VFMVEHTLLVGVLPALSYPSNPAAAARRLGGPGKPSQTGGWSAPPVSIMDDDPDRLLDITCR
jgi:hypothetical protein